MNRLHPFQLLTIVMAVSIVLVSAVTIATLYEAAFKQHEARLIEIVKSQGRLIESIAFSGYAGNQQLSATTRDSIISQIRDAHSRFEGFGRTGEFTLASKQQGQIVFILSHRHYDLNTPRPIPFDGEWAEPMRRALSGESGSIIALDYRGRRVLAAHEPLDVLGLGLVAKVDLAEIRSPFVRAGLISASVAVLIILIASTLFFRLTRPIKAEMERHAETLQTLVTTIREGIFLINSRGIIEFVNPAGEELFGYQRGELLGKNISCITPSPHRERHDQYIRNYLSTGESRIIGTGRQLTAVKKDGSLFPVYLSVGDIKLRTTHLFTGVIMDLTEQQALQRKLMELPVEEQRRIGQELHDGLGQQLTGLGMLAKSLLNKASRPEYALAEQLASGIQDALGQIRALSRGLMPVEIDAATFFPALRELIDEIGKQTRFTIDLQLDQSLHGLDETTMMHLYRITQEGVNNAIKHSGGNRILVSINRTNGQGLLEILDNGRGLSDRGAERSGLGLKIMKHRCGLFDGEVLISNRAEGGVCIRCWFPLLENPS